MNMARTFTMSAILFSAVILVSGHTVINNTEVITNRVSMVQSYPWLVACRPQLQMSSRRWKLRRSKHWLCIGLLLLQSGDIESNPGPVNKPEKKRMRRCEPCVCIACNGRERDHRTIQRHLSLMKSLPGSCDSPLSPSLPPTDSPPIPNFLSPSLHPNNYTFGPSLPPNDSPFSSSLPLDNSSHSPSLPPNDSPLSPSLPPDHSPHSPSLPPNDSPLSPSLPPDDSPHSPSLPPNDSPLSSSLPPNDNPLSPSPLFDNSPLSPINSPLNSPQNSQSSNGREHEIVKFVLKELVTKLNYGSSISEFEAHLSNAAGLIGNSIPTKWADVLKLLHRLGYEHPKHFKVCATNNHSYLLGDLDQSCPICKKDRSHCINYYVLGLQFEDWFCTEEKCEQLMGHWNDREDWLNISNSPSRYTELWHGERWRELSFFWDAQKETLLPEKCNFCKAIIPVCVLKQYLPLTTDSQVELTCPNCKTTGLFVPRSMKGDPRNQAIIIHEDGWAPHSTSAKNSIAAITITKACMTKLLRSANKNAQVYSFIPVNELPKEAPHKMDAFFEPLIQEIEELFMYGNQVFFKSPISGHSPANDSPILRLVPLLCTADMRAHSEIGLTSAGGHKGCRRCEVAGTYIAQSKHYYYDKFHFRYYNRPNLRTASQNRLYGRSVDSAVTEVERQSLVKENGVTGETIFYRLFDLCNFDPVKDLVIDVMHALCLNLIRSEIEKHLLADMGSNRFVPADNRDPALGGVLERKDLADNLKLVEWTTELKDGRVPIICESVPNGKHKLGFWKAEEFGKFVLVAPYVLRDTIPRKCYDSITVLHQLHTLIFSHQLRIDGWTEHHIDQLQRLLWKHAIFLEHLYGSKACTENVECSIHMADDIRRHSTLDNYWCFLYERLVKFYKMQTSNMRSLCKTFADRAKQLQFVETFLDTHVSQQINQHDFSIEELENHSVLTAKTEPLGIEMKNFLTANHDNLPPKLREMYQRNGILLGIPKLMVLSVQQKSDIQYWVQKDNPGTTLLQTDFGDLANSYGRVLKIMDFDEAVVLRHNEHVILNDADISGREWVMTIKNIFTYGPILSKFYHFVDGDYYVTKTTSGSVDYDPWTEQPVMVPRKFRRLCIQPLKHISRKVMLYPINQRQPQYLVIDPNAPFYIENIPIPHYPKVDEIVQMSDQSYVHVVETTNNLTFSGHLLKKINGKNERWTYLSRDLHTLSTIECICNVEYEKYLHDFKLII